MVSSHGQNIGFNIIKKSQPIQNNVQESIRTNHSHHVVNQNVQGSQEVHQSVRSTNQLVSQGSNVKDRSPVTISYANKNVPVAIEQTTIVREQQQYANHPPFKQFQEQYPHR